MISVSDSNGFPIQAVPLGYTFFSRFLIVQGQTTYTIAPGTRAIFIQAQGAGAAGGGVTAVAGGAGGGGGAGGFSETWKVGPKLSAFTVGVGSGGTGVSAANGNPGGDTTFDSPSICTAKGGLGGNSDAGAAIHVGGNGGLGGAAASGVGDFKQDGRPGNEGLVLSTTQVSSGNGGHALLGAGGNGIRNATSAGNPGSLYGGGGSGAAAIAATAGAGGPGAHGVILVSEYS
jgi:hypothetical protein